MKKLEKWMGQAGCAVVVSGLVCGGTANAALFFWDNGGNNGLFSTAANWNPDGVPGAADLVVHNDSTKPPITINGDWSVDSLRLSDGGGVTHNSGTLRITDNIGPDDGLWVGEFGNNVITYTLNGGVIVLEDNQNSFDVGRGNGSVAYFNMNGGAITNTGTGDAFFVGRFGGSYGRFTMTAGVIQGPFADTHIGLDGVGEWFQSGGTFNCAGVQIGRFASPFATVELSGTATWNAGLVLLADGHGVFNPRNTGPVDLKLVGPNVNFNSTGLVLMKEANLTFDGNSTGISTMKLGGGILLLDDAELFCVNLPTPSALGEVIVLIENIGPYPGPDNQFANAPQGTIFDAGSLDWAIDYRGTNIVLVAVPDCVAPTIISQPKDREVAIGSAITLTVGAGGTALEYQWQFNGVDIPGAQSSSYQIAGATPESQGNYRVIVNNACSGLSVTSAVAVLTVLPAHTFYAWDNGGGDYLYNNSSNWDPDGVPYKQDFAGVFIPALFVINGDFQVDTLRTGNGATVLHTNGTLTIVNGLHTDNGLWAGEFGPDSTYTLNGGKIVILDPVDGFMVGRNGDSVSTFNFVSGFITNNVGDTHIGLDGIAHWNQTGGVFDGAGVQIGRFANPGAVTATLSGNSVWDVGLVLLADGHGVFNPRNTNSVTLTLVGPNVSYDSTGLVMFDEGNLVFDGTGGGFSTMNLGGGIFLLNNGRLHVQNPPMPTSVGQEIVLLENIGSYPGADQQFDNAPEGTVYAVPGGGEWTLDYRPNVNPTNIVLVATAAPAALTITGITVSGGTATITFSANSSDTAGSFELWGSQTIAGAFEKMTAAEITALGSGAFRATVPVFSGSTGFYRVRRL